MVRSAALAGVAKVSDILLDGRVGEHGRDSAKGGIRGGHSDIEHVVVTHIQCDGLQPTIAGFHFNDSAVLDAGYGNECSVVPPGAGVYSNKNEHPSITDSSFAHDGPALDDNGGTGGGVFTGNFIGVLDVGGEHYGDGDGWAAVSVIGGSGWVITGNDVSWPQGGADAPPCGSLGFGCAPGSRPGYDEDYACGNGTPGLAPADIYVCANAFIRNISAARSNDIENNTVRGASYGVAVISFGYDSDKGDVSGTKLANNTPLGITEAACFSPGTSICSS